MSHQRGSCHSPAEQKMPPAPPSEHPMRLPPHATGMPNASYGDMATGESSSCENQNTVRKENPGPGTPRQLPSTELTLKTTPYPQPILEGGLSGDSCGLRWSRLRPAWTPARRGLWGRDGGLTREDLGGERSPGGWPTAPLQPGANRAPGRTAGE